MKTGFFHRKTDAAAAAGGVGKQKYFHLWNNTTAPRRENQEKFPPEATKRLHFTEKLKKSGKTELFLSRFHGLYCLYIIEKQKGTGVPTRYHIIIE